VTVEAQNLLKQIHEQVLQNVQDFYGKSLGSLESQLGEHRSQLLELQKQLADSQEDIRAQIGQLVASYEAIEKSLQETAQKQGVEEVVRQAVPQAQEAAGRATQQAQEVAGEATEQVQGLVGQVTEAAEKEPNATKAAKRKAEELGVNLHEIAVSDPDRRITLKDVISVAQR